MQTIRIFFKKLGRAKYISHLDLSRCMQRALRRSGLPVWYTQGFHPHMYLTFALPLSLGYESLCESMDLKLTQDVDTQELLDRLNAALPEGLTAYGAAAPVNKPEKIAWARYEISLCMSQGSLPLEELFDQFMAQDEILVVKRTKRGEKEVDIKPLFSVGVREPTPQGLRLELTIAAGGETNINPALVADAFEKFTGIPREPMDVLRTQILTEDFALFA